MQNKNRLWLYPAILLGIVSLTIIACNEDEPVKKNAASFSATVGSFKITAPTGIQVTFTNTSENATTFSWDFGDGSALSTEESPTHVYDLPGTYTVELSTGAAVGANPVVSVKSIDVVVTDPTASLTNLVQGGQFETADASSWTVIYSGQGTTTAGVKVFNHVNYTFGSTANVPTGGTGGGMLISNSKPGEEVGSVIYQAVNLSAGTYRFTSLIKHDAENRTGANSVALKEYWFETYVGKRAPTFDPNEAPGNDNGYNDGDPTPDGQPGALAGFFYNAWTGRAADTDYPATDGLMPNVTFGRKARTRADKNGVFEITSANAGTYYVIFKAGKGGNGGFGSNGITIDNMRLVKLQ
jgi:PKD repeat protein